MLHEKGTMTVSHVSHNKQDKWQKWRKDVFRRMDSFPLSGGMLNWTNPEGKFLGEGLPYQQRGSYCRT